MYIHDKQSKANIYTPRTAFSFFKEKTALGGIRPFLLPGQLSWPSSNPGKQDKLLNR